MLNLSGISDNSLGWGTILNPGETTLLLASLSVWDINSVCRVEVVDDEMDDTPHVCPLSINAQVVESTSCR